MDKRSLVIRFATMRQQETPVPETHPRLRTGRLIRDTDPGGVSGTGYVADVCLWADGTAAVRWLGTYPSTVHWEGGIPAIEHVHGHGGATRIIWDLPLTTPRDLQAVQGRVQTALQGEIEHWDDKPMREALWAVLGDVQPLLAEVADLREKLAAAETDRDEARAEAGLLAAEVDDARDGGLSLASELAAARDHAKDLRTALELRKEMHEDTRAQLRAQHAEHTAEVAIWRQRIAEAADVLDISGHHSLAALIRRDASIPPRQVPSAYADQALPVPLQDRHRDALATIAMSPPADGQHQAAALITLAREALGLDTPKDGTR